MKKAGSFGGIIRFGIAVAWQKHSSLQTVCWLSCAPLSEAETVFSPELSALSAKLRSMVCAEDRSAAKVGSSQKTGHKSSITTRNKHKTLNRRLFLFFLIVLKILLNFLKQNLCEKFTKLKIYRLKARIVKLDVR